MISIEQLRLMAMSFPEVEEQPHFDKNSFRVKGKIFTTVSEKNQRITVKLSEVDQDVFSVFDKSCIYPVPNKWGKQGWTFIELTCVHPDILKDALVAAYCEVAPKKLVDLVKKEN